MLRAGISCCLALCVTDSIATTQQREPSLTYRVSMEHPETHRFHVVLHCTGLAGDSQDFKMPVWSPGYYGIMDFAGKVEDFSVIDGAGDRLEWNRISANEKLPQSGWRVQTHGATELTLSYDVIANSSFAANPFLDETHGYIVGTGVFLYVEGWIRSPVTVELDLYREWKDVATGLDPVASDSPHAFIAADFDVLYDSPIMMGNLESLPSFEVQGIPHTFIGYELGAGEFDAGRFMKDLESVVKQGVAVFADIPYTHYTFLGIGPGMGGIEHLNSTSVPFHGNAKLDQNPGRSHELSFLAHEYFHNYNVKRVRPVALGPFDYDKENLTNMLWVSEGFTVYYEHMMLARAGVIDREQLLAEFTSDIAAIENSTGHYFQSATTSSWETWEQGAFGNGGPNHGDTKPSLTKTISYYDKGSALALLLDLEIRHDSRNAKSLDTVMASLYRKYYHGKKRGWTDDEFQRECEGIAGVSLQENFDYASTTREIDYDKYLRYAGLVLEEPALLPEAYLGAIVEDVDGKLMIDAVQGGSPAARFDLRANDQVTAIDGVKADAAALAVVIAAKKPGEKLTLRVSREGKDRAFDVVLDHARKRSYRIVPIANPDALQAAILQDWLAKK